MKTFQHQQYYDITTLSTEATETITTQFAIRISTNQPPHTDITASHTSTVALEIGTRAKSGALNKTGSMVKRIDEYSGGKIFKKYMRYTL